MKKKLLTLIIIISVFNSQLYSQCTNTSSYGSASAPTTNIPITISTCNYQTEYNTISNIITGRSYQITNSRGGYITVRSGTYNGPVVGNGNAPFTFTATVSGNHYVHYNTNASCGTATNCSTTTIICTSCSGLPPVTNDDPCNAINLTVGATCTYTTYSNIGATATLGVPAPGCAGYSGGDVWFTATVPLSGNIVIDTNTGTLTDSGMAV